MRLRTQDALLEMFETAQILDESNEAVLTEQELFYAENQIQDGFEIRFDKLHIYSRMIGQQTIISILRSNLNDI